MKVAYEHIQLALSITLARELMSTFPESEMLIDIAKTLK